MERKRKDNSEMSGIKEKIVKLKWPIPIPKEDGSVVDIDELTFGRLKVKHLKALPESFMEDEGDMSPSDIIPLIAGLANIPEYSADEIDMEDLTEVAKALQDFLGKSLKTGKK